MLRPRGVGVVGLLVCSPPSGLPPIPPDHDWSHTPIATPRHTRVACKSKSNRFEQRSHTKGWDAADRTVLMNPAEDLWMKSYRFCVPVRGMQLCPKRDSRGLSPARLTSWHKHSLHWVLSTHVPPRAGSQSYVALHEGLLLPLTHRALFRFRCAGRCRERTGPTVSLKTRPQPAPAPPPSPPARIGVSPQGCLSS